MARLDELRLMAKVARMYYERRMRQAEIALALDLSQATVSRLLKRGEGENIIKITVSVPTGAYPDLEEALQTRFALKEAVVVDCLEDAPRIFREIGSAAAFYLENTLKDNEVVGISSWSATLLAMVDAMHSIPRLSGVTAIQMLGGVGDPSAEIHAAELTRRLARLVHGEARFLAAPGLVGTADTKRILVEDPFVRDTLQRFASISLALVGIGEVEPTGLLASSGYVFSQEDLDLLGRRGAVGNISLRFFNALGEPVVTPMNDRVIGIELQQLKTVKRSVGIAGGASKHAAILGALRGQWINALITDRFTAEWLVQKA